MQNHIVDGAGISFQRKVYSPGQIANAECSVREHEIKKKRHAHFSYSFAVFFSSFFFFFLVFLALHSVNAIHSNIIMCCDIVMRPLAAHTAATWP